MAVNPLIRVVAAPAEAVSESLRECVTVATRLRVTCPDDGCMQSTSSPRAGEAVDDPSAFGEDGIAPAEWVL